MSSMRVTLRAAKLEKVEVVASASKQTTGCLPLAVILRQQEGDEALADAALGVEDEMHLPRIVLLHAHEANLH
jgi:hypothetical protein